MLLSKTGYKYPKVSEIRPIAVTTLPQKIIEHVLLERLENELGKKISKAQFGFRPRMETLMHVLRLIDRLKSIRDSKPKRFKHCLVFIDFSTAFDSIDHLLLIEKMSKFPECSNETINLLKWYLNSIKLRLDNNLIYKNRGELQGGVASPFLWLLYINDLLLDLEKIVGTSNTYAFADDLLICCVAVLQSLQRIIKMIKDWSSKFKTNMNVRKSAVLPLALRKNKKDNFNHNILNVPLVREYKYLGIIFDYSLKFDSSLNKARRAVRTMNNYSVLV